MGSELSKLITKNKEWTKCIFALNIHGKKVILRILHNDMNDPTFNGLPKDEQKLYQFFDSNKKTLKNLLKKQILKADQYAILLPPVPPAPAKPETWSGKMDITLLALVISTFVNLPPPVGGKWTIKVPKPGDSSIAAFIIILRQLRNDILHGCAEDFADVNFFNGIWNRIERALLGLNYNGMADFNKMLNDNVVIDLKDGKQFIEELVKDLEHDLDDKIDQNHKDTINAVEKKIKDMENKVKKDLADLDKKIVQNRKELDQKLQDIKDKDIADLDNKIDQNREDIMKKLDQKFEKKNDKKRKEIADSKFYR